MPLFRFALTKKATEKEDFDRVEVDADRFIQNLLKRGHLPGLKDGSGIIAATFALNSRLEQKNVESVTGVILDVDGKFRRNGELVHEVVDPDWFLAKLPYRGVAHTSYNHSPAHPKYRIILPLAEPLSPAEFHRLWMWLFERVDKKCDPSCKNPDRMFFLPRCTAEAAADKWPWMRELHGPYLSLGVVPPDFLPEESYQPLNRVRKQGAHMGSSSYKHGRVDTHQLLECLLDLPVYKWATENPTVISREVWRGLATNIAAAVLEDDNAYGEGAKAFHTLSEGDADRYEYGVTERTFRDALKSAKHPGPMTYARLVENGAPEDSGSSGHRSPISEARSKLWRLERDNPKEKAPSPEVAKVEGVVAPKGLPPDEDDEEGGDAVSVATATDHRPTDFLFNVEASKWMMKDTKNNWTQEFSTESLGQLLLTAGLPRKRHDAFRSLIPQFHIKEAVFSTDQILVPRDGFTVFNTYKRSDIEPLAGTHGNDRDWPDIKSLIFNLAGKDPAAYEYVLDWIAKPLQSLRYDGKPYKILVALVFLGAPGSGKGTLSRILQALYGQSNFTSIGQEALDGRFNEELIDKLFVVANEVMSSSNRSAQTANKIKPWVTDDMIPVEPKHKKLRLVKNNFNIIFTSNDWRPVLIERDDRRFSVFQSEVLDKGVSDRIYDDLMGDKLQLRAFYDSMLKRVTKIKVGDLYLTDARKQIIMASDASDIQFCRTIKEDGWLLVAAHWVEAAPQGKMREAVILDNSIHADTLYEVYQDFCKLHGAKPFSRNRLMRTLKDQFPEATNSRKRYAGLQPTVWNGFPLFSPETQVVDLAERVKEKEKQEKDDNSFNVEVPNIGA